ncbi:MafI family immunity protein [Rhizobium leguminosarum]
MDVEKQVIELISGFNGRLPNEYVQDYISLAEHNECAVALENLCTQLCEYDIIPTEEELKAIQYLSKFMNLEETTWSFLR